MLRLIPNSLFMRLFLLLAITLTISHLLGMELVDRWRDYNGPGEFYGPPPHDKHFEHWQEKVPSDANTAPLASTPDAHQPPEFSPDKAYKKFGPPHPPFKFMFMDWITRIAGLLIVSWVGARWLSEPINRMAKAANAFGKNLDAPALEEIGTVEVQQAAHALNEMRDKLRRQANERSSFLAAISHDLRTPLTRMQLRVESVEPEILQQKFRGDIAEMSSMLTSALEYLRGHTDMEELQLVDVLSMVQSIAEDSVDQGLLVSVTGAAEPIRVKPLAIRRCLNNLIQNAIKYGSCAEINLSDSKKELVIEVRDKGPGIDPQRIADVFLPFYRLEASRNRATGGVGLGLTIARDIVINHGGELTLQNAKPNGLIARISLPRDPL